MFFIYLNLFKGMCVCMCVCVYVCVYVCVCLCVCVDRFQESSFLSLLQFFSTLGSQGCRGSWLLRSCLLEDFLYSANYLIFSLSSTSSQGFWPPRPKKWICLRFWISCTGVLTVVGALRLSRQKVITVVVLGLFCCMVVQREESTRKQLSKCIQVL